MLGRVKFIKNQKLIFNTVNDDLEAVVDSDWFYFLTMLTIIVFHKESVWGERYWKN